MRLGCKGPVDSVATGCLVPFHVPISESGLVGYMSKYTCRAVWMHFGVWDPGSMEKTGLYECYGFGFAVPSTDVHGSRENERSKQFQHGASEFRKGGLRETVKLAMLEAFTMGFPLRTDIWDSTVCCPGKVLSVYQGSMPSLKAASTAESNPCVKLNPSPS